MCMDFPLAPPVVRLSSVLLGGGADVAMVPGLRLHLTQPSALHWGLKALRTLTLGRWVGHNCMMRHICMVGGAHLYAGQGTSVWCVGHICMVGGAHLYAGRGTSVWWVGHICMVGGAHLYAGRGTSVWWAGHICMVGGAHLYGGWGTSVWQKGQLYVYAYPEAVMSMNVPSPIPPPLRQSSA